MAILPALAVSIAFGSISIPVATTFSMLLGNGAGVEETLKVIILQLRLPKAIAAFFRWRWPLAGWSRDAGSGPKSVSRTLCARRFGRWPLLVRPCFTSVWYRP